MTKCTVLKPNESTESVTLKPIEFTGYLNRGEREVRPPLTMPNEWDNIILIVAGAGTDVMLAHNGDPLTGCIYLGHWNDGVVEV